MSETNNTTPAPTPELARLREENERLRFPHPRLYETQKQLLDVIAERDQLRARVTTLEQRILDDNKAFGCELRDPNGTIWEHADKLQKENADLRQSLENHAQANDKLVVEVADLRRDREDLDWLEKHFHEVRRQDPGPTMDCEPVRFSVWTPEHGRTNRFTDLRSAVRAARAKDAKTEGGV